jgi:predicted nucleotidyltransferase component of viral defense system
MIKPGEIQKQARQTGVRDQQIEKDYIISWILQGIAQHGALSANMVFKGGTVLKKVYFSDYRFSEDLDFTLLEDAIENQQIFDWFSEVFEYVRGAANIPLERIEDNEHEDGGINFYIGFIGPLGGLGANKKVKIDISRSEKMEFAPSMQPVVPGYSDQDPHQLLCYPLEEVLVEKMRSVMQRMQARDFYDIWYLLVIYEMDLGFLIPEFKAKCTSKNLKPAEFHNKLQDRLPQYRGRWKTSMADQIHDLPDFDQVEREAMRILKNFRIE